jgi:hypothetical protein
MKYTPKIYFIESYQQRAVKIGWTGYYLPSRVSTLQMGNPFRLELVGAVTGYREDEKSLHEKFEQYHIRGEWFSTHKARDLQQLLRDVRCGTELFPESIRRYEEEFHAECARFGALSG